MACDFVLVCKSFEVLNTLWVVTLQSSPYRAGSKPRVPFDSMVDPPMVTLLFSVGSIFSCRRNVDISRDVDEEFEYQESQQTLPIRQKTVKAPSSMQIA